METWVWIITAALLPGLRAGDSITPDEQEVSGKEGESVTLRCSYVTSIQNVYLFWYRHRSNQAPQFILYKRASSGEHIPDTRYQSTTSRTLTQLIITQLTLADTALYYCAVAPIYRTGGTWVLLLFGEAISLDVRFKDDTPHVAPTLFILRPLKSKEQEEQEEEDEGPQVCLATGFYPDISGDVTVDVTGGQPLKTSTVISPKGKSYFFAAFSQGGNITSCRMNDDPTTQLSPVATTAFPTAAYPTTQLSPVALDATAGSSIPTTAPDNGLEASQEGPSDQARLNWYLLLTDGLRLIFTKTLALNMLLVARGLLG